jgi:TrmH family RNA methyltransferase
VLATALDHGAVLSFVLKDEGARTDELEALLERLASAGTEVVEVSPALFAGFAQTESPQGILGVAAEPRAALPEPRASAGTRCLVLDAVQDPGNVGTLVRAAAALGAERVFSLDGTADPWSAKAIRASAGLVFALPVHLLQWEEAARWIEEAELPLLVADRAGRDLRDWLAETPAGGGGGWALLLGNEGRGPREGARERAAVHLAIPLTSGADSLNVSTAGAILLWAVGPGRDSSPAGGGGRP